jgi:hypothetical protein
MLEGNSRPRSEAGEPLTTSGSLTPSPVYIGRWAWSSCLNASSSRSVSRNSQASVVALHWFFAMIVEDA